MTRTAQINFAAIVGSVLFVGPGLVFTLGRSKCTMTADVEVSVPLATSYEEVRTRLVRQDPTDAILNDGEVELLGVETVAQDVDLSSDDNPILNALRRRSQATVKCIRRIEVSATEVDPSLDHIVLRQRSLISPRGTRIKTELDSEEECLKTYAVDLKIVPEKNGCSLTMQMEVEYCKPLSPIARWFADDYVRERTEQACSDQISALVTHLELDAAGGSELAAR